jgi:hypothetical protein
MKVSLICGVGHAVQLGAITLKTLKKIIDKFSKKTYHQLRFEDIKELKAAWNNGNKNRSYS